MTSRPSHENGARRSTTAIGLVAFLVLSLAALAVLQTDSSESRSSPAREVKQHAGSGDDSEGGLLQGQETSAPQARELASIDGEEAVRSAPEDVPSGGPDDLTYDEKVTIDQFIRDIGDELRDDPAWYLAHPLLNPDGAMAPPELVQQVADVLARAEEERDQIGDAAGDLAAALVVQRIDDGLEQEDLWPEGANRTGRVVVSTSLNIRGRHYGYKIHVGDDPGFDALWNQRSESMQNANVELAQLVLLHLSGKD